MGTPDNLYLPPYHLTQYPNGINSSKRPVMGSVKSITAAQLLALQTTAVVVEPSPSTVSVTGSVALVLQPERISVQYFAGTTAFSIGGSGVNFQLEYVGKSVALATIAATGLVDQTGNTYVSVAPLAVGNQANTACQNLGFEIKLVGTTPALTLGNGTLKVIVDWTIISVTL
jgi:precorrin-2 methylase